MPKIKWLIYGLEAETKHKVEIYATDYGLTLPAALDELIEYAYDEYIKRKSKDTTGGENEHPNNDNAIRTNES